MKPWYKTITFQQVSHIDFEQYVNTVLFPNSSVQYEFAEAEGCDNNTSRSFTVHGTGDYNYLRDVKAAAEQGNVLNKRGAAYYYLGLAVDRGDLPAGAILIDVSW